MVKYHEKHQCNTALKQEHQGHGDSCPSDVAVYKESQQCNLHSRQQIGQPVQAGRQILNRKSNYN
jgi:hypothetical protein